MRVCLSAVAASLAAALTALSPASAETFQAANCTVESKVMISDLDHPWSVAFVPNVPQVLVTERRGRLLHVDFAAQKVSEVPGVPSVWASGQGGLLDVVVDPDFASNRVLYLSWTPARTGHFSCPLWWSDQERRLGPRL